MHQKKNEKIKRIFAIVVVAFLILTLVLWEVSFLF